ncbi:MAG: hypothetical protein V4721_16580 [Bacteroidota bacterium]
MTNKQVRILLIVILILFLLFFGGRYLIIYLMKDGLEQGWIDKIESMSSKRTTEDGSTAKGIKVTVPPGVKAAIHRNLAKLGFKDLNTLVKFSKLMEKQDYVGALSMHKEIKPILMEKTDLSKIQELGGILFGT